MKINVDSPTTINYSEAAASPATQPENGRQVASKLTSVALAAALLASGAGIGAGFPLLLDAMKPDQPTQESMTDTNTLYRLELVEE